MHFWIDKRSQACGFGRARVAASLSGGGGLGFGHPRRVPRKSMVTPIHRFQTVDCSRPHGHRQQQSQQQPHHQLQPNPSVPGAHYSSTQSQQSSAHQHQSQTQHTHQSHTSSQQQQHHHHHPHHPHHNQPATQQQSQSGNQQQQQQQVHQVQLHLSGQYNSQSNILPAPTPFRTDSQPSPNLQQSASPNALNYHVPVSMNHIYSASTQSSGADIEGISNVGQHIQPHVGHDAQLLPAHLKCGMWASLALATVFVAGAKFYFDHQGTGLEVLIFCAFSATFFLAACTVSLWRRPRDIQITGNNMISETISNAEQSSLQNNPEFLSSNPSPLLNGSAGSGPLGGLVPGSLQQASLASIVAPPPPYHIAILLPDTSKEAEETPPPSYDKVVI